MGHSRSLLLAWLAFLLARASAVVLNVDDPRGSPQGTLATANRDQNRSSMRSHSPRMASNGSIMETRAAAFSESGHTLHTTGGRVAVLGEA